MTALARFTSIERNKIRNALSSKLVADRLIEKIDGVGDDSDDLGSVGVAHANATVDEQGASRIHFTTLTLDGEVITMTDGGANGSIGSIKIYDMPPGLIRILGASLNMPFTVSSQITNAIKVSVGTIPAATNDTLDSTKANIIPSTSGTITTGAGTFDAVSKSAAITKLTDSSGGTPGATIADISASPSETEVANGLASINAKMNEIIDRLTLNGDGLGPVLDGTATAVDIYINLGVANANSSASGTATLTGTLTLAWQDLGDN